MFYKLAMGATIAKALLVFHVLDGDPRREILWLIERFGRYG